MVMNDRPNVIVQVSSAKQFVGQDVLDVTDEKNEKRWAEMGTLGNTSR